MLYERVVTVLSERGRLRKQDKILVVCGGTLDRDILIQAGFTDVTISNLDPGFQEHVTPFEWSYQDAENIAYKDNQFDVAIVHMGLHHCFSPHRALLEMLRVSRRGVLCFENRDSLLLNVAKSLGLTVDYEIEAVADGGYVSGGAGNGPIPNFIYRWTEREVLKTIKSAYPAHPAIVEFFYGLRLPYDRLQRSSRPVMRTALIILRPLLEGVVRLAKKQGNEFGFFIEKKDELQPWLERGEENIRLNKTYVVAHRRVCQ
jgi:ubiquinone/menaquinone biosynthesis C-methylase UbiE